MTEPLSSCNKYPVVCKPNQDWWKYDVVFEEIADTFICIGSEDVPMSRKLQEIASFNVALQEKFGFETPRSFLARAMTFATKDGESLCQVKADLVREIEDEFYRPDVTLPTTVSSEETGLFGLDSLRSSFAEFIAMKFSKDPQKRAAANRIAGNVPVKYVLQTMELPKTPEPQKEVKQEILARAKWSDVGTDGYQQQKIVFVLGDKDNPPKAELVNQWFSGVSVFGEKVIDFFHPVGGPITALGRGPWYDRCNQPISPTPFQIGRVQ